MPCGTNSYVRPDRAKDFREIGLDSLVQQNGRGRKNKLSKDKYLKIVQKHIEANPYQPRKAYALTLEEIDIKVCYNTYKSFLKSTPSKLQKDSNKSC